MAKKTFVKAALLSGAAVSALCVSGLPMVASAQEGAGGQSPLIVAQVPTGEIAQAGSGIIEGRLVDAEDSPIAGAIITIRETGQFVVSDAAGRFRLLRVPSGTYTLVTSVVGRAPAETTVTVTADRTVAADLSLGGPMEEMVVTGLRGSVFSSLNQKRSSDQIIDVLSSAQSDRFPDNNVAEALSRLPGVSFLRDNATGNGDFLSIRGLDAALNTVQFDGVNSGLGNRGDRRVSLAGITADNVGEIRIAKAPLASDEGEGIGGVVNVITRTPLQFKRDRLAFTLEGRYAEFPSKLGFTVGGSYRKIVSENFGFDISVRFRRRFIDNITVDGAGSELLFIPPFTDADGNFIDFEGDFNGSTSFNDTFGLIPDEAITAEDFRYLVDQQRRDTLTISGSIDWQITETTKLTLGGRHNQRDINSVESNTQFDTDDDAFIFDPATGIATATFDDPEISFVSELEDSKDANSIITLKGETLLDRLVLKYQLGYSRASESQEDLVLEFFHQLDNDDVFAPFDLSNPTLPVPDLNAVGTALANDFAGAGFRNVSEEIVDDQVNDRYSAKFDAEYSVGSRFLETLEAGFKFERSEVRRNDIVLFDDDGVGLDGTFGGDDDFTLGDSGLLNDTPFSLAQIGDPLASVGVPAIPDFSREGLIQFRETFRESFLAADEDFDEIVFFGADENVYAGYMQGRFTFGDLKIVAGARIEHYTGDFSAATTLEADVEIDGEDFPFDAPVVEFTTLESDASNTEILPRIVGTYRVNDQLLIRGGFTTSIARPVFDQLAAQREIDIFIELDPDAVASPPGSLTELLAAGLEPGDIQEVSFGIDVGNPDLDNAYSYNLDASFEYYFGEGSAITVGLFYKHIDNFIFEDVIGVGTESLFDPAVLENLAFTEEGQQLIDQLGGLLSLTELSNTGGDLEFSRPQNGDSAEVYGVEFGIYHQFTWLPGWLDGFGFFGNVTLIESEAKISTIIDPEGSGDNAFVILGLAEAGDIVVRRVPFFNSPDITANASLFYEKYGLELALSAIYQGDQFEAFDDFGIDQFQQDYYQLDIDMEYELPLGYDRTEFTVFFEVTDITDNGGKQTTFESFGRSERASDLSTFNGREFRFGIRGRF